MVAAVGSLPRVLVLIAGVMLLVIGRCAASMFDLVVGVTAACIAAYAGLLTDAYAPFRLDRGGDDLTRDDGAPDVIAPKPARGLA